MSFLLHSDDQGWLKGWTTSYGPGKHEYVWAHKRAEAYKAVYERQLRELQIPNAAILEERG